MNKIRWFMLSIQTLSQILMMHYDQIIIMCSLHLIRLTNDLMYYLISLPLSFKYVFV